MTNNTMLTAETITNAQIRALRTEAEKAGDYAQVDICDRALSCRAAPFTRLTSPTARGIPAPWPPR
jgi:hypothetical protein